MSMTRASTVAEEPPAPGIPEPEGDIRQPAPAQDVQPTYLQHPPGYFGGRRHSCSRCDAHSGLGDGFFGGPSPGPCSPGYHILPLQGSPGGQIHNGYDNLPLQMGCRVGMLKPGLQSREGEHTQNSSDGPARAKQVHGIPTHITPCTVPPLPRIPIAPFRTHILRTVG